MRSARNSTGRSTRRCIAAPPRHAPLQRAFKMEKTEGGLQPSGGGGGGWGWVVSMCPNQSWATPTFSIESSVLSREYCRKLRSLSQKLATQQRQSPRHNNQLKPYDLNLQYSLPAQSSGGGARERYALRAPSNSFPLSRTHLSRIAP